jgi:hypothetical protein
MPRLNVTIRMRAELRESLQRSAAEHGRSLSEEIETRLEMSTVAARLDAIEAMLRERVSWL